MSNNVQKVLIFKMALLPVFNRDKKLIIWNFMEELWENNQNAVENKLDKHFKFMGIFENILCWTWL
jgi:hypothetical protein